MTILLVEDNVGDICLFQEFLHVPNVPLTLIIEKNGALAWETVNQKDVHLILLDINLPLINGFELLKKIKTHEIYRSIPVICLSTSTNPSDIQRAYHLQASTFFSKPVDAQGFEEICHLILSYWNRAQLGNA